MIQKVKQAINIYAPLAKSVYQLNKRLLHINHNLNFKYQQQQYLLPPVHYLADLTYYHQQNQKNTISFQKSFSFLSHKQFQQFSDQQSKMPFKAETKQLLNIMANFIYTDKEIFIRELLSNASDALEKQRYSMQQKHDDKVKSDQNKHQIIFEDSGIGMTKQELIDNLGTICNSGTKQYVESLKIKDASNVPLNIIGQFGVGFYSVFIVSNFVEVISKSEQDDTKYRWTSDGGGEFIIHPIDPKFDDFKDLKRGTKIIIHLKNDCSEFSKTEKLNEIIKKYSNFISFPIIVNGQRQNIVQAIWARTKNEVKQEEYQQFWDFFTNIKFEYQYKLHYHTDAPISIKSLLYIPPTHIEQQGIGMEELMVDLYSRKILIKHRCKELLPNWLRFIKGVVDCDDLPLNISRENYQNSMLIQKINKVIAKRIVKQLIEEAKQNPQQYIKWYKKFFHFLQEGLAMDFDNQDLILELMRYEASFGDDLFDLNQYIAKMKPSQKQIYFTLAQTKQLAMSSPLIEAFLKNEIPVLIIRTHIDEMCLRKCDKFKDKKFVNIESNYEDIEKDIMNQQTDSLKNDTAEEQKQVQKKTEIQQSEEQQLCAWIQESLKEFSIESVIVSKRLFDSAAIITGKTSSGMRDILNMVSQAQGVDFKQKLTLEINVKNGMISQINSLRKVDEAKAKQMVILFYENIIYQQRQKVDNITEYLKKINKMMQEYMNMKLQQKN